MKRLLVYFSLLLSLGILSQVFAKNRCVEEDIWIVDDLPLVVLDNPESIPDVQLGGVVAVPSSTYLEDGAQHLVHIECDCTATEYDPIPLPGSDLVTTWEATGGFAGDGAGAVFTPTEPGVYVVDFESTAVAHANDGMDYQVGSTSEIPCTVVVTTCTYGDWTAETPPSLTINKPNDLDPSPVGAEIAVNADFVKVTGTRIKHVVEGDCEDLRAAWYLSHPTATWSAIGDNGETFIDQPATISGTVVTSAGFKPTKPGTYNFTFTIKASPVDPVGDEITATSPSITVVAFKVATQTIAITPRDRSRTTIGVGEEVILAVVPHSIVDVNWSVSGGGTVSPPSGNATIFTAADKATESIVTATIGASHFATSLTVVTPNGVTGVKVFDYESGPGYAGMRIRLRVQPTNVSFYRVMIKELSAPASNIMGYFANSPPPNHDAGDFLFLDQANRVCCDDAAVGPNHNFPPYSPGQFDWVIPYVWQLSNGARNETRFDTITQSFIMQDANGSLSVTKFGLITP